MADTREVARSIYARTRPRPGRSVWLVFLCFLVGGAVAFGPQHEGLSFAGRQALFILVTAAGLWLTEAIPAFAVSLLVMGLAIALLGRPGGGFAETATDWERFIAPWGSPLIWLFFGGFVLAAGASKTGLDTWMAGRFTAQFGKRPALLLLGLMGTTAVLSMFISNTATATLMLAVLGPTIASDEPATRSFSKAGLLGITLGANLGGMGTIIGTPPNAIGAGALAATDPLNFAEWMLLGVPPAVVLLTIGWGYLVVRYLGSAGFVADERLSLRVTMHGDVPLIQRLIVATTFAATVLLWLSNPLHGIPTTVVSFLPTCVLTATGVLGRTDIREIPWDVLLLIAGGLSLGVVIQDTGLADWITGRLPLAGLGAFALGLALAVLTVVLSNLMSNTATANIIIPIALTLASGNAVELVVPIALSASLAMCLPVSTPPNAIVYSAGKLTAAELFAAGLVVAIVGPFVALTWVQIASRFV